VNHTIHDHHEIQVRAYKLWQERGCPWGTRENDWFRAEQELMNSERGPLSTVAREVGAALGNVVSLITEAMPDDRANYRQ
jgi:hypothetical protein